MIRSKAALAVAVATIAACWTAGSDAAIDPQHGAAGIELEMTVAEVIAAKGEPDGENLYTEDPIFGEVRELRYGKTKALFGGGGDDATAFNVRTTSRGQRTADGIGVGSTEEQVREAMPRVECSDTRGFHFCAIGKVRLGKRYTAFVFSNKTQRVKWVNLAIIID